MLPKDNYKVASEYMDETEVITRMMFILHKMSVYNLETLSWQANFDDQGIDSLEQIALLTSFEHEFHTIFEDNVFEHFATLDEVKKHLVNDHNAF